MTASPSDVSAYSAITRALGLWVFVTIATVTNPTGMSAFHIRLLPVTNIWVAPHFVTYSPLLLLC